MLSPVTLTDGTSILLDTEVPPVIRQVRTAAFPRDNVKFISQS